ncbi:hypothetical protein GCM10009775_36950 [Microbacterium aoyamense]|uniref:Fe-S cluster assembly iron-binding protein IscA n=1 Tax=Microbacterium aoyamense TaxID=344166 RepID=A0ABP5BDP6_9MICO|nr:Fe-S cluster assembly protein HesB [Microbacterium aoyamense]
MLTMTDTAAEAVKAIVAGIPDVPDDGGVRIRNTGPERGFEISVAPAPQATDAVIDSHGARLFVEAEAVPALDDRILDAEQGQDGSVRFALANKA